MTVCPQCQTENRDGARFCSKCGKPLQVTPGRATLPINVSPPTSAPASGVPPEDSKWANHPHGTNTQPLLPPSFSSRPEGAIFNERFLWKGLIFSDGQLQGYNVIELGPKPSWLQCAACGAVQTPDNFCIQCGTPLEGQRLPALSLFEAQSRELFGRALEVASSGLVHACVRTPLAAFSETLAQTTRFCMVVPQISPLPSHPERAQVLKWAPGLALALDYLHDTGRLSFQGDIDEKRLGLDQGQAVWNDFRTCEIFEGAAPGLATDVRALSQLVFGWLTGRTQYAPDPLLAPGINRVFERALGTGFATGLEFADALQSALDEASSAAAQTVDLRVGRRTDVGRVRTLNEDSLLALEVSRVQQSLCQPLGVFVVADGMGGHAAGEVASGMIINVIAQKAGVELIGSANLPDRQAWLQATVAAANSTVFNWRKSAGTDMGSTLAMAVIDGNQLCVGHVGDSRAYLINAQGIQRLTTDHSLVERLIATGQITREQARTHDQRNVIYRTMGDKPQVEPDPSTHTLTSGDRLLLCTDGLSGMVSDELMQKIVMEQASPQLACDRLVDAANAAGGEDNISVIVVELAH